MIIADTKGVLAVFIKEEPSSPFLVNQSKVEKFPVICWQEGEDGYFIYAIIAYKGTLFRIVPDQLDTSFLGYEVPGSPEINWDKLAEEVLGQKG